MNNASSIFHREKYEQQNEKKNRRWAVIVTIAAHLIVFLFIWWKPAWQEPDPPRRKVGLAVDFGVVQNLPEQSKTETRKPQSAPEETEAETAPTESSDPAPDTHGTVAAEEKPKKKKKEKETPRNEEKENEEKPAPDNDSAGKEEGEPAPANAGDESGSESDNFEGEPGEGGTSLQLTGWEWVSPPKVNDDSDVVGDIVVSFTVTRTGDVENARITKRSPGIPSTVAEQYRRAVRETAFRPKSSGVRSRADGKVTFRIRYRSP